MQQELHDLCACVWMYVYLPLGRSFPSVCLFDVPAFFVVFLPCLLLFLLLLYAAAAAFAALRTARFHHSVAERCRVKLRLRFTLNILRRGTCTILLLPTQF